MGLTVDVNGLRTTADGYVEYGKEFKTTVASGVRGAALPWTAFPLVDMGFKESYSQTYEALDLATRALGDVLTTIGLALTRVANHYQNREAENTRLFGGKPIVAPPSPAAHPMSTTPTGAEWATAGVEAAGAVAAIVASGFALHSASLPFGAPFIVIEAALVGAAVMNFRDPVGFFSASAGWGDVRRVLNVAAAKVPQMMNDVVYRGKWEGSGKDAFYACINNDIGPSMAAMKDLNNDMQVSCREAGLALLASLVSFIAGTVTAATICTEITAAAAAASATVVGAPAAASAATTAVTITVTSWITFVSELIVEIGTVIGGLSLATATIGQSYDTLKAFLGTKGHTIDAGSISLRAPELAAMQDWRDGWKDPGAK